MRGDAGVLIEDGFKNRSLSRQLDCSVVGGCGVPIRASSGYFFAQAGPDLGTHSIVLARQGSGRNLVFREEGQQFPSQISYRPPEVPDRFDLNRLVWRYSGFGKSSAIAPWS